MAREYTFLDYGFGPNLYRSTGEGFLYADDIPIDGTPEIPDPVDESIEPSRLRSDEYNGIFILGIDGAIRSLNADDYDSGTGFWLGYRTSNDDYGLFIGNSAGNKLTYNTTDDTLSVTGTITASAGDIGGWDIVSGYLYSLQSGTPTSSPSDGIVMASGNEAIIVYENTEKRIELGYLALGVYGLRGYADDGTTVLFELSDSNTEISGWYIGDGYIGDSAVSDNATVWLSSDDQQLRIGEANSNNLLLDGGDASIVSANYSAGANGAGFHLSSTLLEVGNIAARGTIRTAVFQKDVLSSVGGNVAILDSDTLFIDMTAADNSTVTINGETTFANGDVLRIKDDTDDEWMTITDASGAPTYVVDRDEAGSYASDSNPAWTKGATVVNYGANGEGGVYMTASDTNAPFLSVFDHSGSPWTDLTTRVRVGNLNGYLGYSSDIYGIGIGQVGSNEANLTFDPTNGIRLRSNTTTVFQIDQSGVATMTGANVRSASSGARVELLPDANTGIEVIDDGGNTVFEALVAGANVGDVTIGYEAGGSYVKYDKSADSLTVKVDNSNLKMFDAVVDAAGNGDYTTVGAALTAGIVSMFVRDGSYAESTWNITNDDTQIIGESPGGVIVTFTNTTQYITVAADDITIRNMTMSHASSSASYGFSASADRAGLTVENVTLSELTTSVFYNSQDYTQAKITNVTGSTDAVSTGTAFCIQGFEESFFTNCAFQAGDPTSGNSYFCQTLNDCHLTNVRFTVEATDQEPAISCVQTKFTNCYFEGAYILFNTSSPEVLNCEFQSTATPGSNPFVYLGPGRYVGNTFYLPTNAVDALTLHGFLIFNGNQVSGGEAVNVDSDYVVATGNIFEQLGGTNTYDINVTSNRNTIVGNLVLGASGASGTPTISDSGTGNTIANNTLYKP